MVQNAVTGAELTVETGSLAGMRFLLDRPLISIGRSEENDISIEDPMVSKNHCRIITQGDNFLIEDLGSSNGTVVNGQQVNTYMLQDGDKLFLGDTTVTFRKAVTTAPIVAAEAPGAGSRKWIWLTVGIIGGLVLVAAAIVLVLVFVVLPERDSAAPTVSFVQPSPNQAFQINMPVRNGVDVAIKVTATDNKGLDRVEFLADGSTPPIKVAKATTSRKDSQGSPGQKTEEFNTVWNAPKVGDHSLEVKAYDWKGNVSTTETLQVKVDLSAPVNNAHAYVQQIDDKIDEYNRWLVTFNKAYTDAPANRMSWLDAENTFGSVENERRSLLESLNAMAPPPEFAEAHGAFKTTVQYAMNADDAAIQWASAEYYLTQPYYYTYTTPTDPQTYKSQVDSWSDRAKSAAGTFNKLFAAARQGQLDIKVPAPQLQ